ncbi:MAG: hypothetical protein VX438_05825 [Planctomycetota bacterium]|nr:hypothetical protein [Planctomycetota bacterium]
MKRRQFLAATTSGLCSVISHQSVTAHRESWSLEDPPIRTITQGPKFHWFGYYDKLQFDPTNRFVLSNQVDFEHRTPQPDDVIQVGMVDTKDGDRWIELGESRSWGWQQGCMLQWLPGSHREVIWNDRQGDQFVSQVLDVTTRQKRTLPSPVYTLADNGEFGLSADFSRIQIMRPGYGYVGIADPHHNEVAPKDSGIFKLDLKTGRKNLILSLSDVAQIPYQGELLRNVKHYFNHLLISPDSRRFIALHRWRRYDRKNDKTIGGFVTRMITANIDGSDVFVLDPSGHTSHFIWRDPEHVCLWTKPKTQKAAFYLYKDKTRQRKIVGDNIMSLNGHNTYLPLKNHHWILNDTYPDQNRHQKPYLFHVPSRAKFELGKFLLPRPYRGEWRCDTHPRSSNDGRTICIDSPHDGQGRQLHLIDVGQIIDSR